MDKNEELSIKLLKRALEIACEKLDPLKVATAEYFIEKARREEKEKKANTDCKWRQDEFCVNADCPYVADYCPCNIDDSICKFKEIDNG